MDQRQPPDPATPDHQLRERVLAALDALYCPVAPHEELRPFLEGVHGQPVAPADLDRLFAQERRAFDAGAQRPVWLCLGIRPNLRGDPGNWARSDRAPWVRVVHPQQWPIRKYWLVRQLVDARRNPWDRQAFGALHHARAQALLIHCGT
jgi:hypothetical protein